MRSKSDEKRGLCSPKMRAFLAAYRILGCIVYAARAARVHPANHWRWLRSKDYAAAFAEAKQEANARLEEEARRRAVEGLEKVLFYKGEPIMDPRPGHEGKPYVEHQYSDTLLIALLKANMPDKYTERIKQQTEDGLPDEFDDETFEAMVAVARATRQRIHARDAEPS